VTIKRPTVLLADDHAIVAEGLRRVLETNYEVIGVVSNGRAVLAAAEQFKPDVIVLDVSMPLLNGIEAARRIHKSSQNVKIVFLSMHPDVVYVTEAFRAGASAYVLKISAANDILTAVRSVLQGKTYLSPSIDWAALETHIERGQQSLQSPSKLSSRQREVLQLVAEGRNTKEIAEILHISPRTVEFHRRRIMQALGLHSTAGLVQYAIKHRLISS
jgi:DNA-binding NarL/FixJ family response regulator